MRIIIIIIKTIVIILTITVISCRAHCASTRNMSRGDFVQLPRLWVALAFTIVRKNRRLEVDKICLNITKRSFSSHFCFGVSFLSSCHSYCFSNFSFLFFFVFFFAISFLSPSTWSHFKNLGKKVKTTLLGRSLIVKDQSRC